MNNKIIIKTEKEMIELGMIIGTFCFPSSVILLEGDLGAGKTTLTKGIGKALDIKEIINSPTFTILKIYHGSKTLYHFDVYRLNSQSGDEELQEYFYLDGVSVIEWASNISSFLPKDYLKITILSKEDSRELLFESNGSKYEKLLGEIYEKFNN